VDDDGHNYFVFEISQEVTADFLRIRRFVSVRHVPQPDTAKEKLPMIYGGLLAFGFAVGVLSGLLGIGGGIVLVPGLILLFGLSQPEAQGTSLAVLALPVVGFAAQVYYQNGYVRLPTTALVAAGFVLGAYGGARLVPHLPTSALRAGLGLLLLYLGATCLMQHSGRTSQAALPAGVSLIGAAILRAIRRRSPTASSSSPKATACDYHI
jgi:uncharacterized protein